MPEQPVLLGIETSCDDTAAAVLRGERLLSSVVSSQRVHAPYGGVVPELASRDHQRYIVPVVRQALLDAGVDRGDLEAVAATYGPGLAGSLLVGLSFSKALSLALDIPLVGVNHLEGHIYSVFLEQPAPSFPYLCLTVSGGHTQIVRVDEGFRHELLGQTRDDAAGEAFDKVAKLLGLGYPGGPIIDRHAEQGNPEFHPFPRSSLPGYDFSFSGIKTAVLYYLNQYDQEAREALLDDHMADICASFQQAVIDMLVQPLLRAVRRTDVRQVAVVGGVSANRGLRRTLQVLANEEGFSVFFPSMQHCTDNAAMIAIAGYYKLIQGIESPLTLTAAPDLPVRSSI